MKSISLSENWNLLEQPLCIGPEGAADVLRTREGWMDVPSVPSDVRTVLFRNGKIADPYVADGILRPLPTAPEGFDSALWTELQKRIAELGYKIVLTTDHGTVRVQNSVLIIGDKNTNTNLRYKVGKALNCQSKDVFVLDHPDKVGLPSPNLSSSYMFCTGNDFFGYPNNFNYYAQYYKDTFQHGGISMEEMLIPLVTLVPKIV